MRRWTTGWWDENDGDSRRNRSRRRVDEFAVEGNRDVAPSLAAHPRQQGRVPQSHEVLRHQLDGAGDPAPVPPTLAWLRAFPVVHAHHEPIQGVVLEDSRRNDER